MIYVTAITLLLYAAIVFIGSGCDIKENSLVIYYTKESEKIAIGMCIFTILCIAVYNLAILI